MEFWRPQGMPLHNYEMYQWKPGVRGLYESNYIKGHSRDGQKALWIKHNILAPKDADRPAVVELWCVFFERGKEARVVKQELPASEIWLGEKEVRMEGRDILLSPTRTATTIRDRGVEVSWDIATAAWGEEFEAPLIHFPTAAMYRWPLPKKKLLTPGPKMRWDGVLRWQGETLEIRDWIGFRNHNWGSEHAYQYAYGNCNDFADAPGLVVDAFSAKIRLGPWKSPFLSAAVIREGRRDLPFNGLSAILGASVVFAFPRWEVEIRSKTHRLHLTQEAEPKDFIGLPYHHPDGKTSVCYNTKWAVTKLRLQAYGGSWIERESDRGEVEFLFPEAIPGVPLYRADSLQAGKAGEGFDVG